MSKLNNKLPFSYFRSLFKLLLAEVQTCILDSIGIQFAIKDDFVCRLSALQSIIYMTCKVYCFWKQIQDSYTFLVLSRATFRGPLLLGNLFIALLHLFQNLIMSRRILYCFYRLVMAAINFRSIWVPLQDNSEGNTIKWIGTS